MRITSLSSAAILLAIGSQLVQTCQDHGQSGDNKQWTIKPEELAELKELERKWGTDVSTAIQGSLGNLTWLPGQS